MYKLQPSPKGERVASVASRVRGLLKNLTQSMVRPTGSLPAAYRSLAMKLIGVKSNLRSNSRPMYLHSLRLPGFKALVTATSQNKGSRLACSFCLALIWKLQSGLLMPFTSTWWTGEPRLQRRSYPGPGFSLSFDRTAHPRH